MTITIADGRGALWQWDTGRKVKITDGVGVKQIHYQNRCFGCSVDVDVGADGTAIIPDELLQDWRPLTAYAYATDDAGGYTKVQVDFVVHKRAKPADYVYTPTEQQTLAGIQAQIGDLAALTTEAKDTLVAAINEAARTGGKDGKSAYKYAVEGGYTGTEAEFAEKMAAEIPEVDDTMTQPGQAADAKVVGDALTGKQDTISDLKAIRSGAALGATALQSVSTDDIDERAVTNAKISNGAISTGKIAKKAVTEDKLSTEFVAKVDGKQDKITSTNKLAYSLISGTPTIPTVPTALPNPFVLTFTGAVEGSYDGSAPLSVEIPSGGGSGSDVSLGLTGATVGQIAKITAVDASGVPTAWAPVDMAGGEEQWELNATYQYSDLQFPAAFDLSGAKEWVVVLQSFCADVETKINIKFGLSLTYGNTSYFTFFVGTHAWGNAGIIHYCERPVVGTIVDANFGFNTDGSSELHRVNCPTNRKLLNMDAPNPTATLKGGKIRLYRRTK